MNFIKKLAASARLLLPGHDPDFIVIGAQKCATSSLHYYLDQHDNMIGSEPKEIHYFDRDRHHGKSLAQYRSHFRGPSGKLYFESTPSYLYSPGAIEAIAARYPNMKAIVLFREPVARAYSAWNHYRQHFESGRYRATLPNRPRREGNLLYEKFFEDRTVFPSFRECLDIELDLIEQDIGFEPSLLRRGLYLQQLENYWKYFSEKQLMIIGFKDFIGDTAATLERITAFVGADPHDWSTLDREPKNAIAYQLPMREKDRRFVAQYYAEPNRRLFERIGQLNW
ncbi:MAG: sulfotransferase domain-containing protein [Methylomicrobium sp.]|nr:sulfotransferase domain-containing protein [Methylomicrobium sp.]